MAYPGIREEGRYDEIVERIKTLSPTSKQKWGVMRHDQLPVHLGDGMRMILHGSKTKPTGPIRFGPIRYLVLHLMKWPEGKVQAPPGAFERPATTWEEDTKVLLSLLEQYMSTPPEDLGTEHPAFGKMKTRDWDVLVYRHMDHHLRQFSA